MLEWKLYQCCPDQRKHLSVQLTLDLIESKILNWAKIRLQQY